MSRKNQRKVSYIEKKPHCFIFKTSEDAMKKIKLKTWVEEAVNFNFIEGTKRLNN